MVLIVCVCVCITVKKFSAPYHYFSPKYNRRKNHLMTSYPNPYVCVHASIGNRPGVDQFGEGSVAVE